jgi:hypothetical protein
MIILFTTSDWVECRGQVELNTGQLEQLPPECAREHQFMIADN